MLADMAVRRSSLRRSFDWIVPAVLAVLSTGALGTGFAMALTGRFGTPMAPLPPRAVDPTAPGGAYKIVALGDSITEGVGDQFSGGYASRLAEALRARGLVVLLTNLAARGAETDDVLRSARAPEAQRQIAEADLVIVSAGGNDLSHSLRALSTSGEDTSEPEAALGRARANLAELVKLLRSRNPKAAIRLVGIYNPFEITAEEAARSRAQLAEWNAAIEQATHADPRALAVPVADLFLGRPERLAGDRYHPGAKGHEVIARRVLATLPEGDLEVRDRDRR